MITSLACDGSDSCSVTCDAELEGMTQSKYVAGHGNHVIVELFEHDLEKFSLGTAQMPEATTYSLYGV